MSLDGWREAVRQGANLDGPNGIEKELKTMSGLPIHFGEQIDEFAIAAKWSHRKTASGCKRVRTQCLSAWQTSFGSWWSAAEKKCGRRALPPCIRLLDVRCGR